ncbi:MAG: mechanosensitive ion channel [Rhizobiaceae bacterium]|nr:mechanosensitive ion channel [Rhizobiaceae bacterium]
MEFDKTLASIQDGWVALSALAITYSLSVLGAIVLIIVGYIAAGLVERAVNTGLGQVSDFDATLRQFFSQAARYAILILVLVMVLGQFGVQTASIIAAIGAAGLAIGLALQGTLQNIAAGIMILVLRPFRVGEWITVGSIQGTVQEVGLFATRLKGSDGIHILAPNSKLWNEPVYNYTRNPLRRTELNFSVGYDNDLDAICKMLADMANADKRVKQDPAPNAFISSLNDPSVTITLWYWTEGSDLLSTKIDISQSALRTFRRGGIAFSPLAGAMHAELEKANE